MDDNTYNQELLWLKIQKEEEIDESRERETENKEELEK